LRDALIDQGALVSDIAAHAAHPPETAKTSEVMALTVGKLAKAAVEASRVVQAKLAPVSGFRTDAVPDGGGLRRRRMSKSDLVDSPLCMGVR
jgi:hypothetical protein